MTIGALTVGAAGIAFTVATGGAGTALVTSAVPVAVEVAGAIGTVTGTVPATVAGAATAVTGAGTAAATGSGIVGTITSGALAGGMSSTAIEAGLLGASVVGPAGVLIACFKDDTKVQKIDGFNANVGELKEGDKIKSLDMEDMGNENVFSNVTNVTVLKGCFTAHEMHFKNGAVLTATSPHYMIIFNKGNAQMIQACDVKVGDIMCFGFRRFSKVVYIKEVQLDKKVNVEVENGLMYVNGVLATGVCELGPRAMFDAETFLAYYKATHSQAVCA